jgi:hypothetical protein
MAHDAIAPGVVFVKPHFLITDLDLPAALAMKLPSSIGDTDDGPRTIALNVCINILEPGKIK